MLLIGTDLLKNVRNNGCNGFSYISQIFRLVGRAFKTA
jgi:hypothetical protein